MFLLTEWRMNPTLKTCFKCGTEKPRCEFYRHPKMADGHLGKCKACVKQYVAEHREMNIERIRAYDRRRAHEPHRIKARELVAYLYPRKKKRATDTARRAMLAGAITRKPCIICGADRVEGHHHDYDKPTEVIWLCPPHHRQLHARRFSLICLKSP